MLLPKEEIVMPFPAGWCKIFSFLRRVLVSTVDHFFCFTELLAIWQVGGVELILVTLSISTAYQASLY